MDQSFIHTTLVKSKHNQKDNIDSSEQKLIEHCHLTLLSGGNIVKEQKIEKQKQERKQVHTQIYINIFIMVIQSKCIMQ